MLSQVQTEQYLLVVLVLVGEKFAVWRTVMAEKSERLIQKCF